LASLANLEIVTPSDHDSGSHPVRVADPVQQPGWNDALTQNPRAWIFHTAEWSQVLRDSYHHRPFYFCVGDRGSAGGFLPVMEASGVFGRLKGVSLPFTDLCPLLASETDAARLWEAAVAHGKQRGWRTLELRSACSPCPGASPSLQFYTHSIPLQGGTDKIFARLESSVRRGIRKAGNSGLKVHFSAAPEAMCDFFELHCRTRRKHGVPPQPYRFFENITRHLLDRGFGVVALGYFQSKPIAAAVFLQFGTNAIYKFGASDASFQHLRPNNLVLWEGVRHFAEKGCVQLHLGRTSLGNAGLRRFKLGFGAEEALSEYYLYSIRSGRFLRDEDRSEG